MCNLCSITTNQAAIATLFHFVDRKTQGVRTSFTA